MHDQPSHFRPPRGGIEERERRFVIMNPPEAPCIHHVEAHKPTRYGISRASQRLGELRSIGSSRAPDPLHSSFLKAKGLWHDGGSFDV